MREHAATWASVAAAGVALAAVIFSAGDANQRLSSQGSRLDRLETTQGQIADRLAKIEQATADTREVVHQLADRP